MTGLGALLAHILPVALLAAVSPVMFLNAESVRRTRGLAGSGRFILGNALVLVPLGAAGMGLLGAAAASAASRELASRRVDLVLAVILLGYGSWSLYSFLRKRRQQRLAGGPQTPIVPHGSGLIAWGALGMVTNFSSLPLYLSAAQRIGAASQAAPVAIVLLALVIGIVLAPTWLPVAIAALAPRGRGGISPRLRQLVTSATSLLSAGACLVGAVVIGIHALG